MKDRVVQRPNRYKLTPVSGDIYDLAPEPGVVTEPGTDLSKATLLSDETEIAIWGNAADRTVNDALHKVQDNVENVLKVGDIITTTRASMGDDWLLCNGAEVSSAYPELRAVLPTPLVSSTSFWSNTITGKLQYYEAGYFYRAAITANSTTSYTVVIYRTTGIDGFDAQNWETIRTSTITVSTSTALAVTDPKLSKVQNKYVLLIGGSYSEYGVTAIYVMDSWTGAGVVKTFSTPYSHPYDIADMDGTCCLAILELSSNARFSIKYASSWDAPFSTYSIKKFTYNASEAWVSFGCKNGILFGMVFNRDVYAAFAITSLTVTPAMAMMSSTHSSANASLFWSYKYNGLACIFLGSDDSYSKFAIFNETNNSWPLGPVPPASSRTQFLEFGGIIYGFANGEIKQYTNETTAWTVVATGRTSVSVKSTSFMGTLTQSVADAAASNPSFAIVPSDHKTRFVYLKQCVLPILAPGDRMYAFIKAR